MGLIPLAAAAAAVLAAASVAGCGQGAAGDSGTSGTAAVPMTTPTAEASVADAYDVLLTFDEPVDTGGVMILPDASGNERPGLVRTEDGGRVSLEDDGNGGSALGFPDCADGCGRAIVTIREDGTLNPGAGDFSWGARVLLAPSQTTSGSNVVQKGFAGEGAGGQFKLQIDRADGRPTCVVQGGDGKPLSVLADQTVADGRWHAVECRRQGTTLQILVDGEPSGQRGDVPADLDVSSPQPVRVGGKDVGPDNDQYLGVLDDVFVAVHP